MCFVGLYALFEIAFLVPFHGCGVALAGRALAFACQQQACQFQLSVITSGTSADTPMASWFQSSYRVAAADWQGGRHSRRTMRSAPDRLAPSGSLHFALLFLPVFFLGALQVNPGDPIAEGACRLEQLFFGVAVLEGLLQPGAPFNVGNEARKLGPAHGQR